jgi:phospholipid/cholesterol/gamma-HCH transport system permease protein
VSTTTIDEPERPGGASVALGRWVFGRRRSLLEAVDFLGATVLGLLRLLLGRTRDARAVFGLSLQHYGLESLPVVGLIAFGGGLVLTLLGLKELAKVGVENVAPRVIGIVVLREIGPLIVGIALAGRVASSCAAEIATTRTSGRTQTIGGALLDSIDVLVAPRVLALLLIGPLLVAYADALALVGSWSYAKYAMGLPGGQHLAAVWSGLTFKHGLAAVAKGAGFGFVVGLAGCFHGLRAGGPAETGASVRDAVVSAVLSVAATEVALIFIFKWIRF